MKAISIRQPWAWLIVNGYKDIENRTWETRIRGTVAIHAGKAHGRAEREDYDRVRAKRPEIAMPPFDKLHFGAVVGSVEIVDCVSQSKSSWFSGPIGFVLANGKPCKPVHMGGKLGFFDVPDSLVKG